MPKWIMWLKNTNRADSIYCLLCWYVYKKEILFCGFAIIAINSHSDGVGYLCHLGCF